MRRRPNWSTGFTQRFASYDPSIKQALTNRHVIWLHAVSVGEIKICAQIIRTLEPRVPNATIVVSCTTSTGMEEYRKILPNRILKIYYPLDRRKYVRAAIATINPQAIIMVESEIWPNFLWRAHDFKIPVFLANARLSQRSYPRYVKFGWLFRPLFASFAGVACKNPDDVTMLKNVGCVPDRIHIAGNLKFDASANPDRRDIDVPAMLRHIGFPEDALILVAGSTHDGEEAILAEMFVRLRRKHPKLYLILVPRHAERSKVIGEQLRSAGVKFVFRNEVGSSPRLKTGEVDCLLVNTTGELIHFYEPATIAFIGKSITADGGQNPIEPAAFGKPVICGPNMQNFLDVMDIFQKQKAIIQVTGVPDLEKTLDSLLVDPVRRAELGRRARQVVTENLGAVQRTVDMIMPFLALRGVFIARDKK